MSSTALTLVTSGNARTRTAGDRLEMLTALISAPSFGLLLRDDVIQMPPDHPVYGWECAVAGCVRSRDTFGGYCAGHRRQWQDMRQSGSTIVDFLRVAEPLQALMRRDGQPCQICPHAQAIGPHGLCYLHAKNFASWRAYRRGKGQLDAIEHYLAAQCPYPAFGQCRIPTCPREGVEWIGLCFTHFTLYVRSKRPGGAHRVRNWGRRPPDGSRTVEIAYDDEPAFLRWCSSQYQFGRMDGQVSLLGLHPLVRAEIKWGLHRHSTKAVEGAHWPLLFVQNLATECREQDITSLVDLDLERCKAHTRKIAKQMLRDLRLVYFSRQDTRNAGFIETGHYGIQFPDTATEFDLLPVTQRWLRDLLWDCLDLRLTADPPRSAAPLRRMTRGCAELSAYLEGQAPEGGHSPQLLTRDHMVAFIADQRHRASRALPTLAIQCGTPRGPQKSRQVTAGTAAQVFTGARQILRTALETGACERLGLDRGFIVALPYGRAPRGRRRKPFSDEVARALAAEDNLQKLDEMDYEDCGLRDIWEALVVTGRRCGEVIKLRLDCIDRHNNLPMLWHDQTKVGNLDAAIRISERLYQRIRRRQEKTVNRFIQSHGHPPTENARRDLALFTRRSANRSGHNSVSYPWFRSLFSNWVSSPDIAHSVAHQARHTLATNLIKNGANLTHVKRYLGQVSEAMAEHYVHLANTDPRLEQALQAIWVTGPGSSEPGLLLSSGRPMTPEEAAGLAIDLARTSTPADGGFCTFQPVINGDSCPWNLNCHNCDKFVLSGADLLYWHRKREQWHAMAERAPDSTTADFLHDIFEPTARAIAGLEKALDAVGLLNDALSLDLRRPQDYFGRVWATAFPAQKLSRRESEEDQITP
ncbi:tyrosine-type recombinase/integrase [Streptomyces sp. NPDC087901]|uniref:tyrosine-type recombinase/integrase n=1 Tax=Streptomyces sp. NPDC087901 TaxID=3365818 RepID=UPI00382D2B96